MEIIDIRKKKEELEDDILELINEFQKKTYCNVMCVHYNTIDVTSVGDTKRQYQPKIAIEVGLL